MEGVIQNDKKRNWANRWGCKRERERESKRVEKTCSICDAQKLEEIEKGFNIKLGYFEMEKFISNIAELFVLQRSD